MLSLLLEEHGVKWAALSLGWAGALELCLAGACSNHRSKERNQTALHTQRQGGKTGRAPKKENRVSRAKSTALKLASAWVSL